MRNLKYFVAAFLLVLLAVPAMSQTMSGSISGTVKDEQGGVLPGATVSLIGKTGVRTATTDAQGQFRFPVIDPGTYQLMAELSGFKSRKQDNIQISIGRQISLDFALGVGGVTETVEVVGEAPVVDTTSAASNNSLSQDILYNMPIDRRTFNILNVAPGINNDSAFGASDYGNGLLLDGVDTRDPEGGSAWTFFNYNMIEEVQVQGLGASAEYGAFSGGIVNTITKSGGNAFAGLFDAYYTRSSFGSDNTQDVGSINPALASPAKTKYFMDMTGQLSGPIIKDKLFFFVSAQKYNKDDDPSGPSTRREELSHRINLKLTYQPSPNDHFILAGMYDDYSIWGRSGWPGSLRYNDGQAVQETAPDVMWNLQWRHLFSGNTFLEAKFVGWWGLYYLDPTKALSSDPYAGSQNSHFESETNAYYGGGGFYYYADRARNQANVSVSHFAEGFGKHDLKFGLEIERSTTRTRYGYGAFGNNGCCYYYDYAGPYYAYQYAYDVQGVNTRVSGFAQDAWKVNDRLTISPGVRFDWVQGASPNIKTGDQKVFDTKSVAPRIGIAYDLLGDHTTVLKAHYGQYYDGAFFYWYSRATPGIGDRITVDPTDTQVELDRSSSPLYRMDKDIKQPRVDEFTVGFERALGKDFRIQVTGIYRDYKNIISSVMPSARWTPVVQTNPVTGQPITVYSWANRSTTDQDLLITNPKGLVYNDASGNPIGTADPNRNYKGLMVVLTKRMTDRWQAQVSYVLSKATGTTDSYGSAAIGQGRQFESPNLSLINADGESIPSARHEIKAYLTYQVPVVEVGVNLAVQSVSGNTYTPYEQYSGRTLNVPWTSSSRRVLLEARGSRRLDMTQQVDLRLEKIFKLGERKDRIGIYADITNVLNRGTVTSNVTRYTGSTFTTVQNGETVGTLVPFEGPAAIMAPRQVTFGARWSF
jgi:hypothetical protein